MTEKHSLVLPLFVCIILCAAFQPCSCTDNKSIYNIHLKMENFERKIEVLQKREMYLTEITERHQSTILELQTTVTKQQQTINQHQEKIQRQEETIHHHGNLLSDIQNQESQQNKVVVILKRTVMNQSRQINRLTNQLASTEKKLKAHMEVKNDINSPLVKAQGPIKSPQKQKDIPQLYRPQEILQKRLVLNYEGSIAFTTTLTKDTDNIGINQNIVFDHVILNLGNGYHNQHGIFIVPRNGLYVFSASLLFDNNVHPSADAFITHNGMNIAGLYAHGYGGSWDHSSQSVVLQANQGDEVSVRNIDFINTSVNGYGYSSFNGYLLYSM